jgi:hypothetical protein
MNIWGVQKYMQQVKKVPSHFTEVAKLTLASHQNSAGAHSHLQAIEAN